MSAQSVSVGSMFAWVGATLGLLKRNFTTFIAAGALMLALVFVVMLPMGLMMYANMAKMAAGAAGGVPVITDMSGFWTGYGVTMLVSLLGFPPMLIGWFRLCRDLDQGLPARARDILAPYRDRVLWLRSLKFALLAMLVYVLLLGLLGLAFAGPFSTFMQEAAAQQAATLAGSAPVAPHFSGALVFGYFAFLAAVFLLQFIYMVGFAEIALRPTATIGALRLAAAGVLRNALKLFLFLFCMGVVLVIVCIILGIAFAALFALLMLVHPIAGMLAGAALYLVLLLCMYPMMFAGHYLVWKSMLGGNVAPPPEVFDGALAA